MQKIWHVLPCGAMYTFKEYRYEDVSKKLIDYIWKRIPKSELEKLIPIASTNRSKKLWCHRFYVKFMKEFIRQMVDQMLESNRIIIKESKGKKVMMFVGRIPDNPTRIAKARKQKLNWLDEDFKNYAVVLEGIPHSYYFRLRSDRRRELAERIKKGQNFH